MTHQALLQAAAANNHAAQAAAAGLPVLNTAASCSPVITTTSELTPLQLHSADTVASLHPSFQTIPGYHSLYHPAAAAAGPSLLAAATGQATPAEPATPPPQTAGPPPGQGQLLPPTAGLPGLTQLTQLQQLHQLQALQQPQLPSLTFPSAVMPLLLREGKMKLLLVLALLLSSPQHSVLLSGKIFCKSSKYPCFFVPL